MAEEQTKRMVGRVTFWNKALRYGTIAQNGDGRTFHVSYRDVKYRPGFGCDLKVGDAVEFDEFGRGHDAVNVVVIVSSAQSQIKNQKSQIQK